MGFELFFDLAVGFKKPLTAPEGTYRAILKQIRYVESELGFNREKYKDNPWRWNDTEKEGVTDEAFCEVAEKHNNFVIWLHGKLSEWTARRPDGKTEVITVEQSKDFMPGLRRLDIPFERWTEDHFEKKLTSFYEIVRGRNTDGVSFGAEPLNEDQAAQVVLLLHEYIIGHGRFPKEYDVPRGHDYLTNSEDTVWCEQKGWCVHQDDVGECEGCDVEKCGKYCEYYGCDDDEEKP